MHTEPASAAVVGRAPDSSAVRQQRNAMRLSLVVGLLMLAGKWYAYVLTNSAAILSDAAESVVHVAAVAFAAYSFAVSLRPADRSHRYGHDKVSYFSAGVEGMLIVVAAVFILVEAISRWIEGLELRNLGIGAAWVAGAAAVNLVLGLYLVWQGKRHRSLILVANGKHVLTDSWTSLGVIVGVLLVLATGWLPFDPILAIAVAINILWSGGKLVRESIGGLMDESNPEIHRQLVEVLARETGERGLQYHALRHRNSGNVLWVDLHLLFPADTTIEIAHWQATGIESALESAVSGPVVVTTHLEPIETHEEAHRALDVDRPPTPGG